MAHNKAGEVFASGHGLPQYGYAYRGALTRKMLYRLFYLSMFCLGVGFFRSPYVIRQVLQKEQQQKTFQE